MTTYKELKGTNIQAVSSDPSNPIEGQVWYNTTSNVTKGLAVTTTGAWASGGNTNTARYGAGAAAESHTAALYFGGYPPIRALTESYDGTSWTEVNDMNQAQSFQGGTGTQTAAIAFGGGPGDSPGLQNRTEVWNGTNWTEVNNLNTARQRMASAGSYTSALSIGGDTDPSPPTNKVESWNGTNWTEVNDLNAARNN